jgi:hypothetical protein
MRRVPARLAAGAFAVLVMGASLSGCGQAAATPTAMQVIVLPTATPASTWTPRPDVDRVLAVNSYHLDLWDRQAVVLDKALAANDTEGAARLAEVIEANGLTWAWAAADAQSAVPMGHRACWHGFFQLTSRLANGLDGFGSFLGQALSGQHDPTWYDHYVTGTRGIFDRNRANLADQQEASLACERGGPIPSDPPLIVNP